VQEVTAKNLLRYNDRRTVNRLLTCRLGWSCQGNSFGKYGRQEVAETGEYTLGLATTRNTPLGAVSGRQELD